jgi:hypothetical protein
VSAGNARPLASPTAPRVYHWYPPPRSWVTEIPLGVAHFTVCSDGGGASVGLIRVKLGHYEDGRLVSDCEAVADGIGVVTVTVPPAWGGMLMTEFMISPHKPTGEIPRLYETQTSVFQLSGTANGCPLPPLRFNY